MASAEPRLRLFVAIGLPSPWRAYLAARAKQLERIAPGYARWVDPQLLHLTLVFLGNQPDSRLEAIRAAAAAAARETAPFALSMGPLGHFGGAFPRVFWMAAEARNQALARLHAALCAELTAREVAYDAKPFVAHLTLGRARHGAPAAAGRTLAAGLATLVLPRAAGPFTVEQVRLMRSEPSPRGPRYTALGEYGLGAGRSDGASDDGGVV